MSTPSPDPASRPGPPVGLLAELTHRCPLQCPYCSNPLELERVGGELSTEEWRDALSQAADLGVLQVHLSGGEPTARRDLEEIVAHTAKVGLYSNLITAAVLLMQDQLKRLAGAGLNHVQISIQDSEAANADRIGHHAGGHAKKLQAAGWVRAIGLPLTINAPIHRQNIASLSAIIELAVSVGAQRLEVAHVQYYGWALRNRQALMPTREQVLESARIVAAARERLKGILRIDFVVPDYYASRPKPCMGGWGRGIINITPTGKVMPCHAAQTIPRHGLRQRARATPARNLGKLRGISEISRHRLDARAMPLLRVARARLGRLPVPGAGVRRRGRRDRSRLCKILAARCFHARRRRRVRPPLRHHSLIAIPAPAYSRDRRRYLRKWVR